MNASAHLRFCRSTRIAPCQSSEHPFANLASCRSWVVLRSWHSKHSQRRLSIVNALSIAAGPSARATVMASLWSLLIGFFVTHLAGGALYPFRTQPCGNAVGILAVWVPCGPDMVCALVTPAAVASPCRFSPLVGTSDEAPGMP